MCFDAPANFMAGQQNNELAKRDAHALRQQARDAKARGEIEATSFGQQASGIIGAQAAGYAAQGVEGNVGSAADVGADTAKRAALEITTIRNNAALEAWGYKVAANRAKYEGELARIRGITEAGTSIGAGIYQYNESGAPGKSVASGTGLNGVTRR